MDKFQNFRHDYDHITVPSELYPFIYTILLTCHTSKNNNRESTKKQCAPTALHLEHLNHVSGPYTPPIYNLEFRDQGVVRTCRVNLYSVSAHEHTTKHQQRSEWHRLGLQQPLFRSYQWPLRHLPAQNGGVGDCTIASSNILFRRLREALKVFVMSVRLTAWNNSSPTGWIFLKSDFRTFRKSVESVCFIKIWQE